MSKTSCVYVEISCIVSTQLYGPPICRHQSVGPSRPSVQVQFVRTSQEQSLTEVAPVTKVAVENPSAIHSIPTVIFRDSLGAAGLIINQRKSRTQQHHQLPSLDRHARTVRSWGRQRRFGASESVSCWRFWHGKSSLVWVFFSSRRFEAKAEKGHLRISRVGLESADAGFPPSAELSRYSLAGQDSPLGTSNQRTLLGIRPKVD